MYNTEDRDEGFTKDWWGVMTFLVILTLWIGFLLHSSSTREEKEQAKQTTTQCETVCECPTPTGEIK